jgi:hypothetical protein
MDEILKYLLAAGVVGQFVAFFCVAGYAFWVIYRHRAEQKKARTDLSNALRKPFFDKQFELVFEVADVTAYLATGPDEALWNQRLAVFQQLYFGKLCVVEDARLANAMIDFEQYLDLIDSKFTERARLKEGSLKVAYACRALLEDAWHLGLHPLDENSRNRNNR